MTLAGRNPTYYGRAIDDRDWQTESAHMGVVDVDYDVGEDALALRLDVSGAKACLHNTSGGNCFSLAIKRGAITSPACLLYTSPVVNAARAGRRMLVVNTNGTLTWRDKAGTVLRTSTATVSASAYTELFFCIDAVTAATVVVWTCFDGTTWEVFDTLRTMTELFEPGETWFWGEFLDAGLNRGGKLYVREIAVQQGAAADMPHQAAYPRLRVVGAVNPDSNGFYMELDSDVPHSYTAIDLDELPTHDAGTTYWADSGVSGHRNLTKSSVANPLPNPCTVAWLTLVMVGRLGAGDKLPLLHYMRYGGVNSGAIASAGAAPGTVDAGYGYPIITTAPGGGALTRAHADANAMEWGVTVPTNAAASRVTLYPGPVWVYYTASLPLATLPAGIVDVPREVPGSGGAYLIRPDYDHIASERPGAAMVRQIIDVDEAQRRRVRAEREMVPA